MAKIVVKNDSFNYSFFPEQIEAYQLVYQDEHDKGSWRPITFFAERDTIEFKIHDSEFFDDNYFGKIIDLLGFIFSLYCIWLGLKIAIFVYNSGQVSPTLNIPMFVLYVAPTLGFLLISIRYALSFLNFKNRFNEKHHLVTNIKEDG